MSDELDTGPGSLYDDLTKPERLEAARVFAAAVSPKASPRPCQGHRTHAPKALYTESHHVVPQAWQALWQPETPWPEQGRSPDHAGLVLWDARTVDWCRTGHGNTHFLLVRMMQTYARSPSLSGGSPGHGKGMAEMLASSAGLRSPRAELKGAKLAIERWVDAGGSLRFLVEHGQFGSI